MVREMLKHHAFSRYVSSEVQPGHEAASEIEIQAAIREKGGTSYHPLGTCRMGGDDSSVVDPTLRVRGIGNLRIADASIMPTALTAPTHAPTIMIAEKASEIILQD